ncbi:MAG: glutamate--tRNA ligase [Candidatus Aminicenantales bacterium]
MTDEVVRVRFAPSPTGHLHVGAARTALFNWLFARHHDGKFILRIEDTDTARSSEEMTRGIIEGLKWLGLEWDEGPFFQSQRLDVYRRKAEELVRRGSAYYCFCPPEDIKKRKQEAKSRGEYWDYDRFCLSLSEKERTKFIREGRLKAVRFLVPEGSTEFKDLIHGRIEVENRNIEDFVLLRRDGLPTYHLSVVVDDIEARITHVIRGDDHISNTPKQIMLYRAFGVQPPQFAHLALIVGKDRKKLSKRHGETSVLSFRDKGYFPLALFNFLAQMSWSPGEEARIYSVEEMVQAFSLEKVSKGSPLFDLEKLERLNSRLISFMSAQELRPYVTEELKRVGLWQENLEGERKEWFLKLIDLMKQRARTVRDFGGRSRPFLSDEYELDPEGVEKYLQDPRLKEILKALRDDFSKLDDFRAESVEKVVRARAEKEGVKAALLIHAVRMLVLGMPVSPGIFEVLELIGKERTLERLNKFPLMP